MIHETLRKKTDGSYNYHHDYWEGELAEFTFFEVKTGKTTEESEFYFGNCDSCPDIEFTRAFPGDSVVVTISLLDKKGNLHELSLPSDDIEHPININCNPKGFLIDCSIENVFNSLLNTLGGKGALERKKDILAFRTRTEAELKKVGLSKLELTKIHDHQAQLFFDWLRDPYNSKMKKLAEKVCKCDEEDKQKNIEEFEEYLSRFEPVFLGFDYTGWPEFCRWHAADPRKRSLVFDWSCLAGSAEEFARYICSTEEPREYAVERVTVDFEKGTLEQSAVYMPGGPKKG